MEDFTTAAYVQLLDSAARRFRFLNYAAAEMDGSENICLWRHDVDISPQRALALARLEAERGIRATYFVQTGSEFYNAFERDNKRCFREIAAMGHWIGLHFDAGAWPDPAQVEQGILREAEALRHLLQVDIDTVSLHNPATYDASRFTAPRLAGLLNGTSTTFRDHWTYCSDSNGLWRFRHLQDVIDDPATKRLHALTHAEWWQDAPLSPRARIQRCIDGRASSSARFYDELLASLGRPNIGGTP